MSSALERRLKIFSMVTETDKDFDEIAEELNIRKGGS